ncbi:MAG: hypothetical protein IJ679_11015 [Lachnospiraceae bacterium]|nr:hypothetical protein [Lachnospiraceae bacterium]
MEENVIHSRLDLLIRLQDTTTGMSESERNAKFFYNGEQIRPIYRSGGNYILVNHGRVNGLMRAEVYGFEPLEVEVDYEKLDENMPAVDLFLIPSENEFAREKDLLTLSGRLEGLSFVEAINLSRPLSSTREYDPKRKILTIYMPNRRMNMVHTWYGIVRQGKAEFEKIRILRELSNRKVLLDEPLSQEFVPNAPICRIIFGIVYPDGRYLLRVQNDGRNLKHLVRYQVGDEVRCKLVDFHQLEGAWLD